MRLESRMFGLVLFTSISLCLGNITPVHADPMEEVKISVIKTEQIVKDKDDLLKFLNARLIGILKAENCSEITMDIKDKYGDFVDDVTQNNSAFYLGSAFIYAQKGCRTAFLKSNYVTSNTPDYYKSIIIVGKHSGVENIQDLEQAKFYYSSPYSASGYLYPKLFLLQNNVNVKKEFPPNSSNEGISAKEVVEHVAKGDWDAGCVYVGAKDEAWFIAQNIKHIWEIDEQIPTDPIWVNPSFQKEHPAFVERFKVALSDYYKNNNRYQLADAKDSDYDSIRTKYRILQIIENRGANPLDAIVRFLSSSDGVLRPKNVEGILHYHGHYWFLGSTAGILILLLFLIMRVYIKSSERKKYERIKEEYDRLTKTIDALKISITEKDGLISKTSAELDEMSRKAKEEKQKLDEEIIRLQAINKTIDDDRSKLKEKENRLLLVAEELAKLTTEQGRIRTNDETTNVELERMKLRTESEKKELTEEVIRLQALNKKIEADWIQKSKEAETRRIALEEEVSILSRAQEQKKAEKKAWELFEEMVHEKMKGFREHFCFGPYKNPLINGQECDVIAVTKKKCVFIVVEAKNICDCRIYGKINDIHDDGRCNRESWVVYNHDSKKIQYRQNFCDQLEREYWSVKKRIKFILESEDPGDRRIPPIYTVLVFPDTADISQFSLVNAYRTMRVVHVSELNEQFTNEIINDAPEYENPNMKNIVQKLIE